MCTGKSVMDLQEEDQVGHDVVYVQRARLGGGASTGEPDRHHGQGHRVLLQVGGVEGPAR